VGGFSCSCCDVGEGAAACWWARLLFLVGAKSLPLLLLLLHLLFWSSVSVHHLFFPAFFFPVLVLLFVGGSRDAAAMWERGCGLLVSAPYVLGWCQIAASTSLVLKVQFLCTIFFFPLFFSLFLFPCSWGVLAILLLLLLRWGREVWVASVPGRCQIAAATAATSVLLFMIEVQFLPLFFELSIWHFQNPVSLKNIPLWERHNLSNSSGQ
jgi:hypothetical protein